MGLMVASHDGGDRYVQRRARPTLRFWHRDYRFLAEGLGEPPPHRVEFLTASGARGPSTMIQGFGRREFLCKSLERLARRVCCSADAYGFKHQPADAALRPPIDGADVHALAVGPRRKAARDVANRD